MLTLHRRFGDQGEEFAAEYLQKKGYVILDRQWHTRRGEIDLVALAPRAHWWQRRRHLVFVEVKTRATSTFGYPEEAVTKEKRKKLFYTAEQYLLSTKRRAWSYQIDVIAIELLDDCPPRITHFENIGIE